MSDVYKTFIDSLSAFMVLFAVINIPGSVPLLVNLSEQGKRYKSGLAALASLGFYIVFLYLGSALLSFLNVDFTSFSVAGSLVILALAIEMVFDIHIFRFDAETTDVTIVPLVFPVIAGPGSITTMLSLRAIYSDVTILIAILLNIAVVYFVLKKVYFVQRILGKAGLYALRKFFGIILMAISMKLLVSNLTAIIQSIHK
jgi:hypothetical protein